MWFVGGVLPLLASMGAIWFGVIQRDIAIPISDIGGRYRPPAEFEGAAAVWAGLSLVALCMAIFGGLVLRRIRGQDSLGTTLMVLGALGCVVMGFIAAAV
jgi:hypothetical protein